MHIQQIHSSLGDVPVHAEDACASEGDMQEHEQTGLHGPHRRRPLWDDLDNKLQRLHDFQQRFGNTYVPRNFFEDFRLGRWIHYVRATPQEHIPADALEQLQAVEFPFEIDGAQQLWWNFLHELRRFRQRYNHSRVKLTWKEMKYGFSPKFGDWYNEQPALFAQKRLSLNQLQQLREAGYDVRLAVPGAELMTDEEYLQGQSPWDLHFDEMLKRLHGYRQQYGDVMVPGKWAEDRQLAGWVSMIRKVPQSNLRPQQLQALKHVGFLWRLPPQENNWLNMWVELMRYKQLFGDVNVPVKWKDRRARQHGFVLAFSAWFHQQPMLYQQCVLAPWQVAKLEQLGLSVHHLCDCDWAPEEYSKRYNAVKQRGREGVQDRIFEDMVKQLQEWKSVHLTCIVPRQVFDAPTLGEWVHHLRRMNNQGRLPQEWKERLDALDFRWKVDTATNNWHSSYHHLRRHKAKTGNADLPPDYHNKSDKGVTIAARWLQRQRVLYNKQKLGPVRLHLLKHVLGIKFKRPYGPDRSRRRMLIEY